MPTETIQQILEELDDGVKPYRIDIKPRIGEHPLLEIVFSRTGPATYTIGFEHGRDVSGNEDFLTSGLIDTSPVLLVKFAEDQHGAIDQDVYLGCNLIYDSFERHRTDGDDETIAEYYSFAPELINDTQQTAWHLTHRDLDDPQYYAFV